MILHLRAHRDVDEVIKKIDKRTAKEQEIDSRVERMVEEQTIKEMAHEQLLRDT